MPDQKKAPIKGPAKKVEDPGRAEAKEEERPPSVARKVDKTLPTLTLERAYESVDYYTGKASEINRQLSLAGLAVIWVFKTDTGGRQIVPDDLFLPGLLLVVGLALDLLHYVVMGELWERYTKRKDDRGEKEFRVPKILNWPGDAFYYLKIVSVLVAYYFLIDFLWSKVFLSALNQVKPPVIPGIK